MKTDCDSVRFNTLGSASERASLCEASTLDAPIHFYERECEHTIRQRDIRSRANFPWTREGENKFALSLPSAIQTPAPLVASLVLYACCQRVPLSLRSAHMCTAQPHVVWTFGSSHDRAVQDDSTVCV